jgi:hypothetical protein
MDMTWKPVESAVIPQEHLRPVGHVFMPVGAWTDRVQDSTLLFSIALILDLDRRSVSIAFDIALFGLAENLQILDTHRWPNNRLQVQFDLRSA